MARETRGRPKGPVTPDRPVVGFRLNPEDKRDLEKLLADRKFDELPLATLQDLFEWFTRQVLSNRLTLPKRLQRAPGRAA
ncbi:MAG: hypothetical protein GWO44_18255 [Thermoplasmata archaeon]|nr:hypothetical protein [Thermoplasmata archaeon]NIY05142.1 hypothetical protein [Thermoplasmata archaeon]